MAFKQAEAAIGKQCTCKKRGGGRWGQVNIYPDQVTGHLRDKWREIKHLTPSFSTLLPAWQENNLPDPVFFLQCLKFYPYTSKFLIHLEFLPVYPGILLAEPEVLPAMPEILPVRLQVFDTPWIFARTPWSFACRAWSFACMPRSFGHMFWNVAVKSIRFHCTAQFGFTLKSSGSGGLRVGSPPPFPHLQKIFIKDVFFLTIWCTNGEITLLLLFYYQKEVFFLTI